MSIEIFDNNDNEYLGWMNTNTSYFIVNTRRVKNSNYYVLHKSKCPHIATIAGVKKGGYTERNFIKVGSDDLIELKSWFEKHNTNFKGTFPECKTCKPFSEKFINNPVLLFPDLIEDKNNVFFEGAKKQVVVNSYERNTHARKECLEYYGYTCSVCKIDFEKTYGIIGKDFIHVHHLKELRNIGSTYELNPISDLRPVCPNCHAMLHQKNPCYPIDELKDIMNEAKNV